MSVIFNCCYSEHRGGLEAMAVHYGSLLRRMGYEVVHIIHPESLYKKGFAQSGEVVEFYVHGHFDLLALAKLERLIRRYRPAALISHRGRHHVLIQRWQQLCRPLARHRPKTFAVLHGPDGLHRCQHFDGIIMVSPYLEPLMRDLGYRGPIFWLPNFILGDFEDTPPRNFNAPFTFGTLSRLSPEKNIPSVVAALSSCPGARLRIAGLGPMEGEIRREVEARGLSDRVIFDGWIEDRAAWFSKIDALLFTSLRESFGLVILEAWAQGVPVITSDAEGPASFVTPEHDGIMVPKGDTAALAQAMRQLDGPRAQELAQHGFQSFQRYNEASAAAKLATFFQSFNISEES